MIITNDPACIWFDAPQGSDDWLAARTGLLTASRMADAMDVTKSGNESAKRKNLKMEILAERMTGQRAFVFINGAMKWGTDTEPAARQAYVDFTGQDVTVPGLAVSREIEYWGASPDGLVGSDGLLEIKCPTTQVYLEWVIGGVVPEQHKPQMLAQMAVTGRHYCMFVAFDPRCPGERDLFIRRYEPSVFELTAVKTAARQFLAEVEQLEQMFLKARMM